MFSACCGPQAVPDDYVLSKDVPSLEEKPEVSSPLEKSPISGRNLEPEPASPATAGVAVLNTGNLQENTNEANIAADSEPPEKAPLEQGASQKPPEEPFQDRMARERAEKMTSPPVARGKRRPSTTVPGATPQSYVAKHEEVFQELLRMEPMDGWNFKAEGDGVKIYVKQDPRLPFTTFKAIGTLPVRENVFELIEGLGDVERRPLWDDMILKAECKERHFPFYQASCTQIKSPSFLLCNREMLNVGRIRWEEDGGALLALKSFTDPDYPEQPGLVRAEMVAGGYIIRPTSNPKEFLVTWAGCVNPGGWIPTAVANIVAYKQGFTLAKYAKYAAQNLAKGV
eukprot:TRINITY_DN44941_c0_g1_i1.p1 TRINITY_DN44941_c0_g1~~TRINITY_DN44941_c0_g1_i1.p1  ORF type:complete len:341 (-),score=58.76 TRINITY_DN44941_c0_g1_i1:449-1471(-)